MEAAEHMELHGRFQSRALWGCIGAGGFPWSKWSRDGAGVEERQGLRARGWDQKGNEDVPRPTVKLQDSPQARESHNQQLPQGLRTFASS